MWMDESPDQRPAVVRMNELAQTGARTVALGCPFCRIMLETGQTAQTPEMRLADVAELLLEANPKPGP
jgi:Fe-S oxidoreductase